MRKVLLDTNAYTKLLLGREEVLEELGKADIVYMSVIVLGELYGGFIGGTKEQENKKILEKFLTKPRVEIIQITKESAEIFGMLKHTLASLGTPLPTNDIWIASQALEMGAVVVTYDEHFLKIPGIRIWDQIKK